MTRLALTRWKSSWSKACKNFSYPERCALFTWENPHRQKKSRGRRVRSEHGVRDSKFVWTPFPSSDFDGQSCGYVSPQDTLRPVGDPSYQIHFSLVDETTTTTPCAWQAFSSGYTLLLLECMYGFARRNVALAKYVDMELCRACVSGIDSWCCDE